MDIPWGFRTPLQYTEQMLCGTSGIAGKNIDACQGDSGGPLVREASIKFYYTGCLSTFNATICNIFIVVYTTF